MMGLCVFTCVSTCVLYMAALRACAFGGGAHSVLLVQLQVVEPNVWLVLLHGRVHRRPAAPGMLVQHVSNRESVKTECAGVRGRVEAWELHASL